MTIMKTMHDFFTLIHAFYSSEQSKNIHIHFGADSVIFTGSKEDLLFLRSTDVYKKIGGKHSNKTDDELFVLSLWNLYFRRHISHGDFLNLKSSTPMLHQFLDRVGQFGGFFGLISKIESTKILGREKFYTEFLENLETMPVFWSKNYTETVHQFICDSTLDKDTKNAGLAFFYKPDVLVKISHISRSRPSLAKIESEKLHEEWRISTERQKLLAQHSDISLITNQPYTL